MLLINSINFLNEKNYKFIIFIIYAISNGLIILIPNAVYWDDWTLYSVNPSVIFDSFRQAGSMFNYGGLIHNGLLFIGLFTYKYLTFFLMLGSGYLLDTILRRDFRMVLEERFILVLLFLILPLNIARVSLIIFPYTFCYFMFFLAWYFFYKNKFLSLIFFFISFNTNSLLLFYLLPIMGIYYKYFNIINIRYIVKFIINNILFIILPFIYFYLKTEFYKPYGIYENYNSLSNIDYIQNIYNSLEICLQDYFITLNKINPLLIFITIFSLIIFIPLRSGNFLKNDVSKLHSFSFVCVGILAILFALFPYLILGLAPTFQEWSSRHQLLLPLGMSLLLVGILSFFRYRFRLFLLIFIVLASIAINVANYVALYQDWNKQKALIMLFKDNEEIKNAGIVGFIDETKSLNAINRTYRIYEWNGLMKAAFGDEIRFGVEGGGFQWARERGSNRDFVNASNNNKDFTNDDKRPPLIVRILPADGVKNFYKAILNKNAVKIETQRPAP